MVSTCSVARWRGCCGFNWSNRNDKNITGIIISTQTSFVEFVPWAKTSFFFFNSCLCFIPSQAFWASSPLICLRASKLFTTKTCELSGSVAIASSSCLFAAPTPTEKTVTPCCLSRWASAEVAILLVDFPSVITMAILAALPLAPFTVWKLVSLAYFKASAVFVPPEIYLMPEMAWSRDCLSLWAFKWNSRWVRSL